ncbi:MAG: ribonuclease III [Phycisphaerae bacterium]
MEESHLADALNLCQKIIGYQFRDEALLREALTHASVADTRHESNERLEFLGDAVLGMIICQHLFESYPEYLEGELTKIKSAVVSRRVCAEVARNLGLSETLFVGKGMIGRAHLPPSVIAAVFETLIGAMYLDGGLETARRFILTTMHDHIVDSVRSEHQRNFKSQLQQHAQRYFNTTPLYEVLDEKGPDHSKCFEIAVSMNGRQFTSTWGRSKKEAEQKAARSALIELEVLPPDIEAA